MVQGKAKTLQAAKTVRDTDKLYAQRFLVIPGKTDTDAEIESLTSFARSLGSDIRVRLNAFQHHGVRAEAHLRKAGISEVITPALYL